MVATIINGACDRVLQTGRSGGPDVFDHVRDLDLRERFPRTTERKDSDSDTKPLQPATYYGQDDPSVTKAEAVPSAEGFELNFENAPITTVAKVLLGDILGLGYTIDARVQGTVSLASSRPVAKSDLLFVLENALRLSNVVMIRDQAGYRLVPAGEAVGTGAVDQAANGGRPEPGFGTTVIPVRYVSVQTLLRLLEGFASKPGSLRVDPARNLILVQGSGAERRNAVETVLQFDANWLRGQSVGIYPVHNSTPEAVIADLERIIDNGEGGLSHNLIKLQPVTRMNAVLVVARRSGLLNTAATWINRLDKTDYASTRVKVYRVRYGDAKQMAAILNDIFTGQGGGVLETPANQIAPGAGFSRFSSPSSGTSRPASSSSGLPSLGQRQQQGQQSGFGAGGSAIAPPSAAGTRSTDATFGRSSGGPAPLPGVRITADTANNSLLIYASQENYRIIERTLHEIDRPQLQVVIDLTIAEITLNDKLAYGVQFFFKKGQFSVSLHDAAQTALKRVLPGFNFLLGREDDPRVVLDALRGVTQVKVLSSPSVVVVDNQVATLQVGDQVPITTRTATAVESATAPIVSNIDYRNTGVILRVAPRVNANGNVLLNIEQEISNVAETSANTLTPTVSQRQVKSSIAVASGQTVLLAGLISERTEGNRAGIPGLERLDVLGDLFAHTKRSKQRTELIIFIRPQIIRDGIDARRIAEELRAKLRGSGVSSIRPPLIKVPLTK